MHKYIKFKLTPSYSENCVFVELLEFTTSNDSRWHKQNIILTEKVKMNSLFFTAETLPERVYKKQDQMVKKYKESKRLYESIEVLKMYVECGVWSVADGRTEEFFKKIT